MNLSKSRTPLLRRFGASPLLSLLVLACAFVFSGVGVTAQQPATVAAPDAQASPALLKWFVTVTDGQGRFIDGLTKDDFKVFEGKSEREIAYFEKSNAPASVAILLDVSGSMESKGVKIAQLTAARFIEQADARNAYYVGDFYTKWRELTGWTQDAKALIAALRKAGTHTEEETKALRSVGLTALHDACLGALEKLERAPHPKRVLLVITDGGTDNASTHKLSELRQRLKASDVLLYTIAIDFGNQGIFNQEGQQNLDELTRISGGRAFFPATAPEIVEVVDRAALELRNQYVVGFAPASAAAAGKWNKVKIKVEPRAKIFKKLWARSREGYFSTATKNTP
ncbi:MAG TPA: VWA domain-containing protein [Pyrinomonadaceae bacterium]